MYASMALAAAGLAFGWLLPKAMAPGAFGSRSFTLVQRLATEPRVLVDYLGWILFPLPGNLGLFHDAFPASSSLVRPLTSLASAVFLAIMAAWASLVRRRLPLACIGIWWFLLAHAITASFLPLELVFEHRNYFASLGVVLVLIQALWSMDAEGSRRRLSILLAIVLTVYYAAGTFVRAVDWSDSLQFSSLEARRHPDSPRATYQYAHALGIESRFDPASPAYARALQAYAVARRVPGAGILAAQGQLILQAKAGQAVSPELWGELAHGLVTRPIGPQETSALGAITQCAVAKACQLPESEMLALYGAAMSRSEVPEVMSLYANYVLNVLGDRELAERLWREAHRSAPREAQYVIALAKLAILARDPVQANAWIAELERMDPHGRFRVERSELHRRMAELQLRF
jgi:hypothetical protein